MGLSHIALFWRGQGEEAVEGVKFSKEFDSRRDRDILVEGL